MAPASPPVRPKAMRLGADLALEQMAALRRAAREESPLAFCPPAAESMWSDPSVANAVQVGTSTIYGLPKPGAMKYEASSFGGIKR